MAKEKASDAIAHVVGHANGRFAAISTFWLPRITRSADLRTFIAIASYANAETSIAFPRRKKIAEDAGLLESQVSRAIAHLKELGAIVVHGPNGRAPTYTVVSPAEVRLSEIARDLRTAGVTLRQNGKPGAYVIAAPPEQTDEIKNLWALVGTDRALEIFGYAGDAS